jgi:hypothetical protein
LASQFLGRIYNHQPSQTVFWTPERVSDSDVLQKVKDAQFNYTFIDQMRHVTKWFGRSSALGNDGYRINQINGTNAFVINDGISGQLFTNDDNGLPVLVRQLLSRKARDAQQDQVVTFVTQWEDFADKTKADAYDKNLRWLASRPWIQIVTPDQIASNQVTYNGQAAPGQWGSVSRGTNNVLPNVSKDFLDHATEENYDNWYFGSALEESLQGKVFNIRTGVAMPAAYGLLGANGIVNSTWQTINPSTLDSTLPLSQLARATMHASEFETAFHNQTNNDLSKFSTGAYISPDTTSQTLAGFSKVSQSQTREAAIYARVNTWATAAASGAYSNTSVTEQADVDLDGEKEYLLYNDRLFAVFERIGGRMTGAWLRDIDNGYVAQVAGNFASYAGSETEEEGAANFTGTAVNAFRTSGFKDWFVKTTAAPGGTFAFVNDYYSAAAAAVGSGWTFTSSNGNIAKTITLEPGKSRLLASYSTTGVTQMFVRFGLAPDLLDLLTAGQTHLGNIINNSQEVDLFNSAPGRSVRAYLKFGGTGFSGGSYNAVANDTDTNVLDSVAMRNQAQTQQVEIQGSGNMSFAIGFETGAAITYDSDADGLPDWWLQKYFGHATGLASDLSRAGDDADHDGLTNAQEYILGSNPIAPDAPSRGLTITRSSPTAVALQFATLRDRVYHVLYSNSVAGPWQQAGPDIAGTGGQASYVDDGSGTGSAPTTGQKRFYKLQVSLVP